MMRKKVLFVPFFILIFLAVASVKAQITLLQDKYLADQELSGRNSIEYAPLNYSIRLTRSEWQIRVLVIYGDLQVNIGLFNDSKYNRLIMNSSNGEFGHFPYLSFNLTSTRTVYVQVTENSIMGNSSGTFAIGVFEIKSDTNPVVSDTIVFPTTYFYPPKFTNPNPFGLSTELFAAVFFFFIFSILVIAAAGISHFSEHSELPRDWKHRETFRTEAPLHMIPKKHRPDIDSKEVTIRTDGTFVTTVLLPISCPNCGAPLATEKVEWVGPLSAECPYCGAIVRAKLEKL